MKNKVFKSLIFTFVLCLTGFIFTACDNNDDSNVEYTVSIVDYSSLEGVEFVEIKNSDGDIIQNNEYKTNRVETLTVTLKVYDKWTGQIYINNEFVTSSGDDKIASWNPVITKNITIEIKTLEDTKRTINFTNLTGSLADITVRYMEMEFPAETFDAYIGEKIELSATPANSDVRVVWKGIWGNVDEQGNFISYYSQLSNGYQEFFYVGGSGEVDITFNLEYKVRLENNTFEYIDCDFTSDNRTISNIGNPIWVIQGGEVKLTVDSETKYSYYVEGANASGTNGVYIKNIVGPTKISLNIKYHSVVLKNNSNIYDIIVHGDGLVWSYGNGYIKYEDGYVLYSNDRTLLVMENAKLSFEIKGVFFGYEIEVTNAVKTSETSNQQNYKNTDYVWETEVISEDIEIAFIRMEKQKYKVNFETNRTLKVEPFYTDYPYMIYSSLTPITSREFYYGEMISILVAKQERWLNTFYISADFTKYENDTNDLFVVYVTEETSVFIEAIEDEYHFFKLNRNIISSTYQVEYKLPGQTEWESLPLFGEGFYALSNRKLYVGESVLLRVSVNYGCTVSVFGAGVPVSGVYTVVMGKNDVNINVYIDFGIMVRVKNLITLSEDGADEPYLLKINGVNILEIDNAFSTTGYGNEYGFYVFVHDVITIEFLDQELYEEIDISCNINNSWLPDIVPVDNVYEIVITERVVIGIYYKELSN